LYVCFFISGCAPVVASSGFAKTTSLANTSAVNNGDSQNPSVHNPSLNEKIALAVEDNFRKNYEKEIVCEREVLNRAEKHFDKSLNILNIVVSGIGVLVTLLAFLLAIGGTIGWFNLWKWKKFITEKAREANELIENLKKKRVQAEAEIEKIKPRSLDETPSKEIVDKLSEYGKKIELLEMFGATLTSDDYFTSGMNLYYQKKYELSLEAFNKSLELEPDQLLALYNKGILLLKLNRHEEALSFVEQTLGKYPNDLNIFCIKGEILRVLERYEEALNAVERVLKQNAKNINALIIKSQVLNKLGKNQEALKTIDEVLDVEPNNFNALNTKGVILVSLARFDEALNYYDRALPIEEKKGQIYFNKACCYAVKKDKIRALEFLRLAIMEDPTCYKKEVLNDPDFKDLRNDEDFKNLTK
jgi:tetratricopeptide (TPR) repeat protein